MSTIPNPPDRNPTNPRTGGSGPSWWTVELQTIDTITDVIATITTTNSTTVLEAAGWQLINAARQTRQARAAA